MLLEELKDSSLSERKRNSLRETNIAGTLKGFREQRMAIDSWP